MNEHDAFEEAYKNGYEAGKRDATNWISVEDRLPMPCENVLVCYKGAEQIYINTDFISYLDNEFVCCAGVTHWMPLPEFPEEVRNG